MTEQSSTDRPSHRAAHAHAAPQAFRYPLEREFVEPDWTRLPGYQDVTREQWESAQWQRAHCVKNLAEFREALGPFLTEDLTEDIARDQRERATMSMQIPPQMVNKMDERDLGSDPVRRYMAPAFSERHPAWPSHPMASRDSLHEADMWAVEGLTHRYPTKVLAELLSTCPQYCGHCTRMDLVGNDTPQFLKYKFEQKQQERWDAMLDYLRRTPQVRDVVVSGGDVANLPIKRLESFVSQLLDIENIRDVRLATKGLMGIPQHFLQDEVLAGLGRLATRANERGVDIAVHTHINCAQQVTPLVAKAVRSLLDMGFRDVRNQGVLLRGVNTTPADILELCFTLLDHGLPSGLRDAAHGLRRPVRRQALGQPARRVRPRAGHLVLDEELPHWHRVRGSRGAHPPLPLLRPDLDAARGGQGVLARTRRRRRAATGGRVAAFRGNATISQVFLTLGLVPSSVMASNRVSRRTFLRRAAWAGGAVAVAGAGGFGVKELLSNGERRVPPLTVDTRWPVKHVVYVMLENRSFNHLFGAFPGVRDGTSVGVVDGKDVPLITAPEWMPADLPHDRAAAVNDVHGGRMDGFGAYDQSDVPAVKYAMSLHRR